jgi:energy-coupling factor transporter ATP-binding protein EcfA2
MHPGFIDKIISPEQWKKRIQTSQPSLSQYRRKKQRSVREPKWCHKPQDETPPDHVFFTLDTKEMDAQMERMVVKVITFLRGQAYEDIDEISALRKKMLQLKLGPEKPDWSYALVGKHGEGKSTLANCLLGRHKLAGAAKSTKSCTQFATEFRYKTGAPDDTKMSDVTIAFFDDLELKDITEENVMRYGHVHHRMDEEEEDDDDASLQPALTRAVTAYDENLSIEATKFFSLIVKGNKQAEKELEKHLKSSKSFTDGSLVEFLLRKQREHFDALGVNNNNNITYHNVPDKLGLGSERGALDIAAVRKKAESLFPLVRLVTVATGGMLLRYGLVFVDIPGKSCI